MMRLILSEYLPASDIGRWTTAAERAAAEVFAPRRRAEYLSWRAIVRRELGDDVVISYDACGAPQVNLDNVHISVAHCEGRIAVVVADRRCAVDIEPCGRNFDRAADRFVTPDEKSLAAQRNCGAAIVWCAKECLYKLSARRELDLLRDIHIDDIDPAGHIIGHILDCGPVRLTFAIEEGCVVVCA